MQYFWQIVLATLVLVGTSVASKKECLGNCADFSLMKISPKPRVNTADDKWFNDIFHETKKQSSFFLYDLNTMDDQPQRNSIIYQFFPFLKPKLLNYNKNDPALPKQIHPMITVLKIDFF